MVGCITLRLRRAEFFHTNTHAAREPGFHSLSNRLGGPEPLVCAKRVVRCLKGKETVRDELFDGACLIGEVGRAVAAVYFTLHV